jgi:hypothetical protein
MTTETYSRNPCGSLPQTTTVEYLRSQLRSSRGEGVKECRPVSPISTAQAIPRRRYLSMPKQCARRGRGLTAAVARALTSKVLVITGGPGVGKTTPRQCHPAHSFGQGCKAVAARSHRTCGQAHERGHWLRAKTNAFGREAADDGDILGHARRPVIPQHGKLGLALYRHAAAAPTDFPPLVNRPTR